MYPYGIMNETEQLRCSKAHGRTLAHEWRMANWSGPGRRAEAPCPGRLRRALKSARRMAGGALAAIARRVLPAQTGPRSATVPARRAERGC
jgi:hypothetical protein